MEARALVNRLKDTYFSIVVDDPVEAHMNLYTCMQDLITEVQNNRHAPDTLRESARILRLAWDHDYRSTTLRNGAAQADGMREQLERMHESLADSVNNWREAYPDYLDTSGAAREDPEPFSALYRDAVNAGQESVDPQEAPSPSRLVPSYRNT